MTSVLSELGISSTTWYRRPRPKTQVRGRPRVPIDEVQMDVTYLHLPQGRWWYIVSVIDYYSRYLLTRFLTFCGIAFDMCASSTGPRNSWDY
ncbi:MAG: transposase family protein [Gammaproteobacteria bacterium]|nr:transposase family protein [Gammaproteobacteria bacterium]MYI77591.1 transposase family protein [Gammaproteobacteria bacterium]